MNTALRHIGWGWGRLRSARGWSLLVLASACQRDPAPPAETQAQSGVLPTAEPSARSPAAASPTTADTSSVAASSGTSAPRAANAAALRPTPTPAVRMQFHFTEAEVLRSAIVAGEPKRANAEALKLSQDEWTPNLKASWKPHMSAMQDAARAFAAASDLPTAGQAVGKLGVACATCHQAIDGPKTAPGPMPDSTAPMTQHAWAIERMWWGLFAPNDAAWSGGAAQLAQTPIVRSDVEPVDATAKRLEALAKQAVAAPTKQRAEVFGSLLQTCASCHRKVGVKLGSGAE